MDPLHLLDLPDAVLEHVFSFLDMVSLSAAAQCCRRLSEVKWTMVRIPDDRLRYTDNVSGFLALKRPNHLFFDQSLPFEIDPEPHYATLQVNEAAGRKQGSKKGKGRNGWHQYSLDLPSFLPSFLQRLSTWTFRRRIQ